MADATFNEVTGLEYNTLKVPYELLNKKFRAAQKTIDQQVFQSKRSKNALTDLLKKSDRSIDVEPVRVEFSQVTDRLRKFLKSFDEIVSEEENAAQTFGSRTKYLKQGFSSDPAISSAFRKQRTNRFIIDYFLRAGYFETAQKLAEYVGIDNIDRNVFHVAKQVEDGLQRHDLSICLNWVLDNRSKLHRLHSNFETEVRVQQLIELIKNGQRQESINFIRATFGGPDKWTNETLLQVMGLLAFGPATGVSSYQKLVISERWEQILDMFREENAKIFRLSPQSAFSVCLQVGLAAYKTPFCKNNPDSRCIICRDLYDLAYGLPFSNVKNSRLICAYSGESLDDENNRPVMLPNGQVYGERAINQLVRDNVIMCPKSSEFFPADKLQRVGSGLRNTKFDIRQTFPRLQRLGQKLKNLVKKDSNLTEKTLQQAHGYYICRFLGFYHTDPESRPLQGNIVVSDDCLAFYPKEEHFKLIIPFDQIECISTSDHLGIKSALQLYKTDGSVLFFSKIIDQKKAFEVLYNVWRSNQNSGFENEVDRGARESDEDSTSSSEGPRIMSGMSNSKTVLENTKVVTTASTATTDTVSLNQATLPGTSNARKEPADCDCGEHKGTVFVDKIYALEVDELYQLLFTENESLLNFLKTAKRSDLRYESWTAIEHGERRKKKRTARYTVELSSTLGPKCTHVTEVQVVAEVGPNAVDGYTITKDAVNAGVPYADSFSVFCTYCITRVGPKKSRLKVHGEIVYRKSVMGVFKSIIERMTLSGMHDYYKHLDKYLSSCGSKEETSRNGAGSDWISEFPESEMDTQLESESLQSQDPPSVEIRLRAELVTQRNEIRAQAASLREIQKSLRLVVLLLVLIFVLCISNTYRYSQLDFNSIASGQSFTKPEL